MAALLNINFIAFALAHLGAALVYSARTIDQTDKETDRRKKKKKGKKKTELDSVWELMSVHLLRD